MSTARTIQITQYGGPKVLHMAELPVNTVCKLQRLR